MFRLALLVLLLAVATAASQDKAGYVYVKGYVRKDGTVVQGHYRHAPGSAAHTEATHPQPFGRYEPPGDEAYKPTPPAPASTGTPAPPAKSTNHSQFVAFGFLALVVAGVVLRLAYGQTASKGRRTYGRRQ